MTTTTAAQASIAPQGASELREVASELVEMSLNFATCIPFLPLVAGQKNIGRMCDRLTKIAAQLAALPPAIAPAGGDDLTIYEGSGCVFCDLNAEHRAPCTANPHPPSPQPSASPFHLPSPMTGCEAGHWLSRYAPEQLEDDRSTGGRQVSGALLLLAALILFYALHRFPKAGEVDPRTGAPYPEGHER